MKIQELFTELNNLFSLLCYDNSKLGTTRAISAISMGKSSKFDSKNCIRVQISPQENIQMTKNLVLWQDWENILVHSENFWNISIFRPFFALQSSNFDHFCHFWPKFAFEIAENHQNIKISKNPLRVPRYYPNHAKKTNIGYLEHLLLRYLHTNISKSHFLADFSLKFTKILT